LAPRTLPRSRRFPKLAHIIDDLVRQALTTDSPTNELLRAAQNKAAEIRL
jgi:hypothetical protein